MTDCSSFHSSSSSSDGPSSRGVTSRFRIIRLIRPNQSTCRPIVTTANSSFGFAIRGGREFGIGFFVSRVEKGSESDLKGLKVGDQIVRVNGYLVDDAVHRELSQFMSCQDRLTLKVRGVGMLPIKEHANDPLTWHMIPLRTGSSIDGLDEYICRDVRITLNISPRTKLGLGLCKGPEWKPGIFVQFTHEFSIAREAGLRPGDQLLSCNDIDFTNILFSEAVAVMKASHRLELIVRTAAGIDLFPGESSGYNSSASSVTGDQSPCWGDQASKRLSIVKEEDGNEKLEHRRRRSWDHSELDRRKNSMNIENSSKYPDNESQRNCNETNNKTVIRLSSNGTVINNTVIPNNKFKDNKTTTVIFGHDDKVTIKENSHTTNTTKNNIKVNINAARNNSDSLLPNTSSKIADICLVSRQSETKTVVVEVHRSSTDDNNSLNIPPPPPPQFPSNDRNSLSSSLSLPSLCDASSLSSAISEEFKKRAERKKDSDRNESENIRKGLKKGRSFINSENDDIHNALMNEFKLKHKKMFKNGFLEQDSTNNKENKERQNELKGLSNGNNIDEINIPKIRNLINRYPDTPTPDYDISPSNSIKTTTTHPRLNGQQTSDYTYHGTMGRCAASEMAKANGDVAEMESLESFKLTTPNDSNVKPPAVYFNPQSSGPPSMKKLSRPISVSIGEYIDRKEPNRFDFISKSNDIEDGCVTERLKTELERTLSRSNLKKKNDLVNGKSKVNINLNSVNNDSDSKIVKHNLLKTQSDVMEKISSVLLAQQLNAESNESKVMANGAISKTQLRKSESTPIINGILKNGNSSSSVSSSTTTEHKNITFMGVSAPMNRIQKLILSEYTELEDTVLIESPFAQVTLNGLGLRQVQLALTPTRLLIGSDFIIRVDSFINPRSVQCDAEIETLELISAIPLDAINMSIISNHQYRQILQVNLGVKRQLYFEFGGHFYRNLHFNIWRDTIDLLRAFKNKLPCAEFLSRSSVCSEVDNEIQRLTHMSQTSNFTSSSMVSIQETENYSGMGGDHKFSEFSEILSISNIQNRNYEKRKPLSFFTKLKRMIIKPPNFLNSTPLSSNEKCEEYLMRINVPTYGAANKVFH